MKDFLTYRIEQELGINEINDEIQNDFHKLFKYKLNEYGISSPIELNTKAKREFYNDIIESWNTEYVDTDDIDDSNDIDENI